MDLFVTACRQWAVEGGGGENSYQASMLLAGREAFIEPTSRGFNGFIGHCEPHHPLFGNALDTLMF